MNRLEHKIVIIKADDLNFSVGIGRFRTLMNYIWENDLALASGVVGHSCRFSSTEDSCFLRSLAENSRFEFWNHGYTHRRLSGLSRSEQEILIRDGQMAVEDFFGRPCTVFGAPFNDIPATATEILAGMHSIEAIYKHPPLPNKITLPASNFVPLEFITNYSRQPRFSYFVEQFGRKKPASPLIIQIHPNHWNEDGFREFAEAVDWLRVKKFQFVTTVDFVSYIRAKEGTGDEIAIGAAASIKWDEDAYAVFSANIEVKLRSRSNFRDYFLAHLERGSLGIARFMSKSLVDASQGNSKSAKALDLGSGIGNWVLAFCSLNPLYTVTAVDNQEFLLNEIAEACKSVGLTSRVRLMKMNMQDLDEPEIYDYAWSVDALNYCPDWERAIQGLSRALKQGGSLYLAVQQDGRYLARLDLALSERNLNLVEESCSQLLASQLYRVGIPLKPGDRQTLGRNEIYDLLRFFGFDILFEPRFFWPDEIFDGIPKGFDVVARRAAPRGSGSAAANDLRSVLNIGAPQHVVASIDEGETDAEMATLRCFALIKAGRAAEVDEKRLVALGVSNSDIQSISIRKLFSLQRFSELRDFEPEGAEQAMLIAICRMSMGDHVQAIELVSQFAELRPKSEALATCELWIYAKSRDFAMIRVAFERLIALKKELR